jgi:uncharacterized membrane protein
MLGLVVLLAAVVLFLWIALIVLYMIYGELDNLLYSHYEQLLE